MTAKITFFPVGNGDMTLVTTESGKTILIDMNIRSAADDKDDSTFDVATTLKNKLKRDDEGRLYVDVLLISHPDEDHCRGLEKHFHLGPIDQYSKESNKIVIKEFWSSPMVFRRKSKNHSLCEDAKAFNKEAKRRVKKFQDSGKVIKYGDRILILGEDEDGKTDGFGDILIKVGEKISKIDGLEDNTISVLLLAPLAKGDVNEEEILSKNDSSIILQITFYVGGKTCSYRFLTGGDAGVAIWERLWNKYGYDTNSLKYDILQAPHHCSWHSLSHDSWSKCREQAKVSQDALKALSQAQTGAVIVASSESIKDNDNDPPCIRARQEYLKIIHKSDDFKCTGEHLAENDPDILEFKIIASGIKESLCTPAYLSGIGDQPISHG